MFCGRRTAGRTDAVVLMNKIATYNTTVKIKKKFQSQQAATGIGCLITAVLPAGLARSSRDLKSDVLEFLDFSFGFIKREL